MMVSTYSRAGYYKAPLSKGWIIITGGMSAVLILALRHYQDMFQFSISTMNDPLQMWRLPVSRLAFLNIRDSFCGLVLLYYIRIFERRYGTKNFASYLFSTGVLAIVIELAVHVGLNYHELDILRYISPGPLSMLFALLVPYVCDVPASHTRSIMGLHFNSKTVAYILWLQLLMSSPEAVAGSFSGIVAAMLYRFNVLWIGHFQFIPDWLSSATFGRMLGSKPPFPGIVPLGATLEIERQRRIEYMEQQILLLASFRHVPNSNQNHSPRIQVRRVGDPWVRRTVGQLTPGWRTGNHSSHNNISPRQQHGAEDSNKVNGTADTVDSRLSLNQIIINVNLNEVMII